MGNNINDPSASGSSGDDKMKKGSFALSQDPVVGESTDADVQKYNVAPESHPVFSGEVPAYEDLGSLPSSYDEDTLFLVARDPRWLFCYWDFDWSKYPAAAMRGGRQQFFLKVLRTDGSQETIVEITPEARNWYVSVSTPETLYLAEIGFFARDGGWATIVASGAAKTPPDALADDAAANFATVPAHLSFERLLELVKEQMAEGESLLSAVARITGQGREIAFQAGIAPTWTNEQKALLAALLGSSLVDRVGLGSAEIDQLLRKELQKRLSSESASGFSEQFLREMGPGVSSLFSGITSWGASWSAQPFSVRRERGFFMHVNAEIIFYGGTHPDATVWIDGKEIKLSPEGNFSYHFTLPDGDFAIPIVARSPDKVEQRSATLSFVRGTSKAGEVGDTAQPAELNPLIGKK